MQHQIFADEVPNDFDDIKKLAEKGDINAQFNLGLMYANGQRVPQDYKQAVYWLTKAAEQGLAGAQSYLVLMYAEGQGVPQDYKQAVYWLTKAAEQGDASAQFNLGWMYGEGQGVPQNNKLAYVWFSLAAVGGNADARQNRDYFAQILTPQLLAEAQELAAKLQYRITTHDEDLK